MGASAEQQPAAKPQTAGQVFQNAAARSTRGPGQSREEVQRGRLNEAAAGAGLTRNIYQGFSPGDPAMGPNVGVQGIGPGTKVPFSAGTNLAQADNYNTMPITANPNPAIGAAEAQIRPPAPTGPGIVNALGLLGGNPDYERSVNNTNIFGPQGFFGASGAARLDPRDPSSRALAGPPMRSDGDPSSPNGTNKLSYGGGGAVATPENDFLYDWASRNMSRKTVGTPSGFAAAPISA
jgi:hypothetical protein